LVSLLIVALIATPCYLGLLWRFREPLALFALREALRRRGTPRAMKASDVGAV
jgi:hypothetical protein